MAEVTMGQSHSDCRRSRQSVAPYVRQRITELQSDLLETLCSIALVVA